MLEVGIFVGSMVWELLPAIALLMILLSPKAWKMIEESRKRRSPHRGSDEETAALQRIAYVAFGVTTGVFSCWSLILSYQGRSLTPESDLIIGFVVLAGLAAAGTVPVKRFIQ